ncbi:MAG: hypothetical protein A4E72_00505 [Syntrophus sp. PtaU1.Bin208]|nr:MAG: hypothetical protein A4E72_00505 [Syntrophus sp. PtaU1.Bin208]
MEEGLLLELHLLGAVPGEVDHNVVIVLEDQRQGLGEDVDVLRHLRVGEFVDDPGDKVRAVGDEDFHVPHFFPWVQFDPNFGENSRRPEPAEEQPGEIR